jgi:hypothetical protein
MKTCKCGCLITKQSIVDDLCDRCYMKRDRKRNGRNEQRYSYMGNQIKKMAAMQYSEGS